MKEKKNEKPGNCFLQLEKLIYLSAIQRPTTSYIFYRSKTYTHTTKSRFWRRRILTRILQNSDEFTFSADVRLLMSKQCLIYENCRIFTDFGYNFIFFYLQKTISGWCNMVDECNAPQWCWHDILVDKEAVAGWAVFRRT